MGAGKTTVGRALAAHLQLPTIDTDEEIVKQTGKTIVTLFEEHGEAFFRDLEQKVLQNLSTSDLVVTTGGGIVLREQNRDWMKQHGILIYLYSDFHTLWDRLQHDETRPLLLNAQRDQIEALYHSRLPLYDDHHFAVNTSLYDADTIVSQIAKTIKTKYS